MSQVEPGQSLALPVIAPQQPRRATWVRGVFLRLYRLGVVMVIVLVMHRHHARLQIDGDAPIRLEEVRPFFASAAKLSADESPRRGLFVFDRSGKWIGYVLRTSPVSDSIMGYAGPTDTLVALNLDMRVVGISIRHSGDTRVHVRDIKNDAYFMKTWDGKSWDEVAGLEPRAAGIEGVSGASLTSIAIANGMWQRFRKSKEAAAESAPPIRIRASDYGLLGMLLIAIAFTFSPRLRSRTWPRRVFQLALIGYVGFYNGQLLAQSLIMGWAGAGPAWRIAPGLALLLAAALIVPWSSRRALYCSQFCPHGAAQELLGRITRRKVRLWRGLEAGLRWLPVLLIAMVLTIAIWQLPIDLASIEPFDAYLFRTAGFATIVIAIAGLIAAIFVPMAYCKYGCPTGALFSFLRSHGKADRFGRRDWAAGALVLLAVVLYIRYDAVHQWISR